MAFPQANTYTKGSGSIIRLGSFVAENVFDSSPAIVSNGAGAPTSVQNQIPVLSLHASGARNFTDNRQYRVPVSGRMAVEEHTEFSFRTSGALSGSFNGNRPCTFVRPNSYLGVYPTNVIRQGWMGLVLPDSPYFQFIFARRNDALLHWMRTELGSESNPESVDMSYLCLTGQSMGAWGTWHYGLRRPGVFAAIYGDRPRVQWDDVINGVDYGVYRTGYLNGTVTTCPQVDPEDGGGSLADIHNGVKYVLNTANFVPWLSWCIGRKDGYMPFQDHIDFVAAMRATGRPFAMAWNDGNHSGGMILSKVLASYPYGTFQIGKGYPHFTNHSLDIDPTLDPGILEGGINLNLAFRSVIETATGWACEVTSIAGPCTVDVRPYNSPVFTTPVTPKTVTIPGANVWVAVSFSA